MMSIRNSYNHWAQQYDTNQNKTRDLEAVSFRKTLAGLHFKRSLEIGCGTGKNSDWLWMISDQLIAIDLSLEEVPSTVL
jgi:predicted TPR repeat methyltransferase